MSDVTRAAFEFPGVFLENDLSFVDPHDYLLSGSNLAYYYARYFKNLPGE